LRDRAEDEESQARGKAGGAVEICIATPVTRDVEEETILREG